MKKILIIIGIIFLNGYAYSNSPTNFVDYPAFIRTSISSWKL